jgi:hypothetical protein
VPQVRTYLQAGASLVPAYPGRACRTKVKLPPGVSYPHGTVLAERPGTPGVYVPYRPGAPDGTGLARLLLEFDCGTDEAGNVTQGSMTPGSMDVTFPTADAFFEGEFYTTELVGLDDVAVAQLGSLIQGTVAAGVLRLR